MSNKNKVIVFDNDGTTFDRYSIINLNDGEMYGSSEHPYSPQGFGQYCGNIVESYMKQTYGAIYPRLKGKQIKSIINNQISIARNDIDWLGKEIKDLKTLPEDVQKYIKYIIE